jgi:GST-like protein
LISILYFWIRPNGYKVTILLEELGWKYNVIPINIGRGEQFQSDFLKVSPNKLDSGDGRS